MLKHAILFGINNYGSLPQQRFARADAESVVASLKMHYGFSDHEISLCTCAQNGVYQPLSKWYFLERFKPSFYGRLDLLFVGFWGHGLCHDGQYYLCPMDFRLDSMTETGVSMNELETALKQLGATNTCLILDCCMNNSDRRGSISGELMTSQGLSRLGGLARSIVLNPETANPRNRLWDNERKTFAVLSSCSNGQCAYEWEEKGHGYFTAHLLEAMSISMSKISDIFNYINRQLPRTAKRDGYNQQPFFRCEGAPDLYLPATNCSDSSITRLLPESEKISIKNPEYSYLPLYEHDELPDIKSVFKTEENRLLVSMSSASGPAVTEDTPAIETAADEPELERSAEYPPLPQELQKCQAEIAGIQKVINELRNFTHPLQIQYQAAEENARQQFSIINNSRQTAWQELSPYTQSRLEEHIRQCSNEPPEHFQALRPPEIPSMEFMKMVEWGLMASEARLVIERMQKTLVDDTRVRIDQLEALQKKLLAEPKTCHFQNEVFASVLSVLPGYDQWNSPLPSKDLPNLLSPMLNYQLGWTLDQLRFEAEVFWRESRPAVIKNRELVWKEQRQRQTDAIQFQQNRQAEEKWKEAMVGDRANFWSGVGAVGGCLAGAGVGMFILPRLIGRLFTMVSFPACLVLTLLCGVGAAVLMERLCRRFGAWIDFQNYKNS